jgi:5-methylthioadenosine/S-adenosylhomocysteine deaminase
MATLGAARAAGLDGLIGSLEPGKRADLVIRRRDAVELGPGVEPAHQLVTLGHGPTADTVLVNGEVVLEEGRSTRVDQSAVIAAARASAGRMAARLGLGPPGRWPRV